MAFLQLAATPGPITSAPGDGSRTMTITSSQTPPTAVGDESHAASGPSNAIGALRLRGAPPKVRQSVAWDDDVVDNEGAGKKSSKICCIYHKPRQFDESSGEDSSGSDSDSSNSSSESEGGPMRPSSAPNHQSDHAAPSHRHHRHNHHRGQPRQHRPVIHDLKDYEPNAYEIDPAKKGKGKRKAV